MGLKSICTIFMIVAGVLITQTSTAQTLEFSGFRINTWKGTTTSKLPNYFDAKVPYSYWGVESNRFNDGEYFKASMSWFEGDTHGEYEGVDYQVLQGSMIKFSGGLYEPVIEEFINVGYGLYFDFGWAGVNNGNGSNALKTFTMVVGLEVPYTLSFNDWSRIHGEAIIGNTWNEKEVFSGLETGLSAEFHFIPIDHVILTGGVEWKRRTTTIDANSYDDLKYKVNNVALTASVIISLRGYGRLDS